MNGSTVRTILDAFGLSLAEVRLNPIVVVALVLVTYWTRRLTAKTHLPAALAQYEEVLDTAVCWFGPWGWAMLFLWAVEPKQPVTSLAVYALVYDGLAVMVYARFAKGWLEAAWGPIPYTEGKKPEAPSPREGGA